MRVLMLSWEYPPKIVGGIARHVEELAWAMVKRPGMEVHVVTCEYPGAAAEEIIDGVHVHRVAPYDAPGGHRDFIHWVHQLNAAMHDRADAILREWLKPKRAGGTRQDPKNLKEKDGIILHAHDWLTYFAALRLKHTYKLPLVATIHATEYGRNKGISNDIQRYINGIEIELCTEAWRVIVCSNFMQHEVEKALYTPWDKMDVIYNGINTAKFDFAFSPEERQHFRDNYSAPNEKILMFVGRGVPEKGAQVLIDALPRVRAYFHDTKLVICGGGYRQHLVDQAFAIGMGQHVYFTGFVPDEVLLKMYKSADVACFPSLYEPFGIVALEAMAAHTPVVVSDAGGLPEVVEADVSGTVTWAGSADSLAWGILRILHNPTFGQWMANNAYERAKALFDWDLIADQTCATYSRVGSEYSTSVW